MQIRYLKNQADKIQDSLLNDNWSKLGFMKRCYQHLICLQKKHRFTSEVTMAGELDLAQLGPETLIKLLEMPQFPQTINYQPLNTTRKHRAHYEFTFFCRLYNTVAAAYLSNDDINLFDIMNNSRFARKELPVENRDPHILSHEANVTLAEFNISIEPDSVHQLKHETDTELSILQTSINQLREEDVRKASAQFVHDQLLSLQQQGLLIFKYRDEKNKSSTYDLADVAKLTNIVLKPHASEEDKFNYLIMAKRIHRDKTKRTLGKALASLFCTLICAACIAVAVISFPGALGIASILLGITLFAPGPLYLTLSSTYFFKQNVHPLKLAGKMQTLIPETKETDIVISSPIKLYGM